MKPDAAADDQAAQAVVRDATVLVRADHGVDLAGTTFARDSVSVEFFGGPTWSAYGVTFPVGKCSNDGSGVQYNSAGAAGKSTGSNAIELVPSDGGSGGTSLLWSATQRYTEVWQGAEASSSPWRAGASFDVADADGIPPVHLARVLDLPSQPFTVTSPAPSAHLADGEALEVRWTPSDGLRVDVEIGDVSCAGNDNGSLVVPANLLTNKTSGSELSVTRSRVRRMETAGQVVHVIVTETVSLPLMRP